MLVGGGTSRIGDPRFRDETRPLQLNHTALLQDDLVLVTPPGPRKGEPIAFVDALDETLAMPEQGDTVRTVASRTAHDLRPRPRPEGHLRGAIDLGHEEPAGARRRLEHPAVFVGDRGVRAGTLSARPMVIPALRRTLFLASSEQRGPFKNEAGLTGAVRQSLTGLLDAFGPLAHPLWARPPSPRARGISARCQRPIMLDREPPGRAHMIGKSAVLAAVAAAMVLTAGEGRAEGASIDQFRAGFTRK